ncbi:MAG: hypothetical protein L0H25_05690 [Micrococcales bacterium]|nr:hypothetical protein [Micrococcales bacterium]
MDTVKKIAFWVVLGFMVYAVFTNPDRAADIVGSIWNLILDGFDALQRFFTALLNRT